MLPKIHLSRMLHSKTNRMSKYRAKEHVIEISITISQKIYECYSKIAALHTLRETELLHTRIQGPIGTTSASIFNQHIPR